jgi:hypothetical protein
MDRIVGIDPGKLNWFGITLFTCTKYALIGYRDLIHAVTSNDGMDNKTTRKASSFSVSNGEYQ